MTTFSVDELAALLAGAYRDGWEAGHMLVPPPDPADLFIGYQDAVLDMCDGHVEH